MYTIHLICQKRFQNITLVQNLSWKIIQTCKSTAIHAICPVCPPRPLSMSAMELQQCHSRIVTVAMISTSKIFSRFQLPKLLHSLVAQNSLRFGVCVSSYPALGVLTSNNPASLASSHPGETEGLPLGDHLVLAKSVVESHQSWYYRVVHWLSSPLTSHLQIAEASCCYANAVHCHLSVDEVEKKHLGLIQSVDHWGGSIHQLQHVGTVVHLCMHRVASLGRVHQTPAGHDNPW